MTSRTHLNGVSRRNSEQHLPGSGLMIWARQVFSAHRAAGFFNMLGTDSERRLSWHKMMV
jgi:hypothetical protein